MKYITSLVFLLYLAVLQGCVITTEGKEGRGSSTEENKGALGGPISNSNLKPRVTVEFLYSTDDGNNFRELQQGNELRTGDKFQIEFTALDKCFISVRHQFHGGEEFLVNAKGIEVKEEDKGLPKILPSEKQHYTVDERNTLGQETLIFSASFELEKGVEDNPNDPGTFVASVTFKHIPY